MGYHEEAMDVDLYPLLRQYALKNSTYEIPFSSFVESIQRMARAYAGKSADIAAYGEGSEPKISSQLYVIASSKRISLITSEKGIQTILLPERFIEPIRQEYKKMDEAPDVPFPDEDRLSISLPVDWVLSVSLETDLGPFLQRDEMPDIPISRITFSSDLPPVIILTDMIKEELLSYSVLKVRHYLRKGANFEFTRRKLLAAFQNKEMMLKDALNLVLTRPFDAVEQLKSSRSDIVYSFWAYLLSHMRQDLLKRGERTPEDQTILQAACLVEFFNNFYKGLAQKSLELETAYRNFDQRVRKAPYMYSYDDLCAFTDTNGKPLMGKYSRAEFDEYLKSKTHVDDLSRLPEIITYQSLLDRRYYTAKDRVLIMAVKLLSEARQEIRTSLIESWFKLIGEFKTTRAMEDDIAYREELMSRLKRTSPILETLITEKLVLLSYIELKGSKDSLPEIDRLFECEELVPIDELLSLPRKGLLTDVRILLPFWYSIGPIVSLVRFFRAFKRKKTEKGKAGEADKRTEESRQSGQGDRQSELKDAALRVERSFVPAGMSLDDYLVELESKWNTLINPQSKRDLTEDVNSLIRDYLRGVIRTMRGSSFTPERVQSLAETLVGSPALLRIKNSSALRSYVIAYMVRLVKKAT